MRRQTGCYDRLNDQIARALADALFVRIGGEPRTQWLPAEIQLERGLYLDQLRYRADWSASAAVDARSRTSRPRPLVPKSSRRETPATVRSNGLLPPSVTATAARFAHNCLAAEHADEPGRHPRDDQPATAQKRHRST
jgi:hypothetical protein